MTIKTWTTVIAVSALAISAAAAVELIDSVPSEHCLMAPRAGVSEAAVFVTVIGPVGANGTTAISIVDDTCVTEVAGTPSNFTVELLLKPIPLIETLVPGGPLAGANDVSDSVGTKSFEVVAEPAAVSSLTGPRIAPSDTRTRSWFGLPERMLPAAAPGKITWGPGVSPLPLIVRTLPVMPEWGVKLVIFGRTVNVHALVRRPPGAAVFLMVTGPVMAALGTVA